MTPTLSLGIRTAGVLGSRRGELVLARLARKVELLHGARDLLAQPVPVAGSAPAAAGERPLSR